MKIQLRARGYDNAKRVFKFTDDGLTVFFRPGTGGAIWGMFGLDYCWNDYAGVRVEGVG